MLTNILSNAVKFTPAGGSVTVSIAPEGDGALAIRVADTGIGIDPAEIPRVLQPFQQVDNSHTRRYGGTGLGLPLTKRLVELQHGTMRIDSRPGEGTTVTVTFPTARDDRAVDAAAAC